MIPAGSCSMKMDDTTSCAKDRTEPVRSCFVSLATIGTYQEDCSHGQALGALEPIDEQYLRKVFHGGDEKFKGGDEVQPVEELSLSSPRKNARTKRREEHHHQQYLERC